MERMCNLSVDCLASVSKASSEPQMGQPALCITRARQGTALIGDAAGGLTLWDTEQQGFLTQRKALSVFRSAKMTKVSCHYSSGTLVAAAGSDQGSVRVVDVGKGACTWHWTQPGSSGQSTGIRTLQYQAGHARADLVGELGPVGPHSPLLLLVCGGQLLVHDTRAQAKGTTAVHTHGVSSSSSITSACWVGSHASPYIATGSQDGVVGLWDIRGMGRGSSHGVTGQANSGHGQGMVGSMQAFPQHGTSRYAGPSSVSSLCCEAVTGELLVCSPSGAVSVLPLAHILAGAGHMGDSDAGLGTDSDADPYDQYRMCWPGRSLSAPAAIGQEWVPDGRDCDLSPCGTTAAVTAISRDSGRGCVFLWSLADRRRTPDSEGPGGIDVLAPSYVLEGHAAQVHGLVWGSGGTGRTSGDELEHGGRETGVVIARSVLSRALGALQPRAPMPSPSHDNALHSPRLITACEDGRVRLWAPLARELAHWSLQHADDDEAAAGSVPWSRTAVYGTKARSAASCYRCDDEEDEGLEEAGHSTTDTQTGPSAAARGPSSSPTVPSPFLHAAVPSLRAATRAVERMRAQGRPALTAGAAHASDALARASMVCSPLTMACPPLSSLNPAWLVNRAGLEVTSAASHTGMGSQARQPQHDLQPVANALYAMLQDGGAERAPWLLPAVARRPDLYGMRYPRIHWAMPWAQWAAVRTAGWPDGEPASSTQVPAPVHIPHALLSGHDQAAGTMMRHPPTADRPSTGGEGPEPGRILPAKRLFPGSS